MSDLWMNHSFWLSFHRPCSGCQQKSDYLQIQILSRWVFDSTAKKKRKKRKMAKVFILYSKGGILRRLFLVRQRSSTPWLDRALIWRSRLCTSIFPASVFWKLHQKCGYACVIIKATYANKLVMCERTNLIW